MPTHSEPKTVQTQILAYAEAIGWMTVSREEAEERRGFDPKAPLADRVRNRSLFFDDMFGAEVREFNPRYVEVPRLREQFHHLHTAISTRPL